MSCACERALRSMVSRPREIASGVASVGPQDGAPAENGVERCAKLVRDRGEKVILQTVGFLGTTTRLELAIERRDAFALGHSLLGDVAKHQHGTGVCAIFKEDRRGAVVNRALGPVLRNQHGVVRETHHDAVPERNERRVLDRLARLLVDHLEYPFKGNAICLFAIPASQRFRHGIHEHDATIRPGRDHGIPDTREHGAKPLALLAEHPGRLTTKREIPMQPDEGHSHQAEAEHCTDRRRIHRQVVAGLRLLVSAGHQIRFETVHLGNQRSDFDHLLSTTALP